MRVAEMTAYEAIAAAPHLSVRSRLNKRHAMNRHLMRDQHEIDQGVWVELVSHGDMVVSSLSWAYDIFVGDEWALTVKRDGGITTYSEQDQGSCVSCGQRCARDMIDASKTIHWYVQHDESCLVAQRRLVIVTGLRLADG